MKRPRNQIISEPNIIPLCDAAMTLIVIFLITLPAVNWSGLKVDSTRAEKKQEVQTEKEKRYLAVNITRGGLYVNGALTRAEKLPAVIRKFLKEMDDKTVIILPDDDIILDTVVQVLDIAQTAGAEKLALLKPMH